jgi:hypothetical protein
MTPKRQVLNESQSIMNRLLQSFTVLSVLTTMVGVSWASPSLAEKPSLNDGIVTAQPSSSALYAQANLLEPQTSTLTLVQLQNATYQIPLLGKVTLNNGVYQSQSQPAVEVRMSKKFVLGDVNKDGGLDAVTVLRVTEPGRKPTYYLAAMTNQNGQPSNMDTISIGQGFGVQSLSVNGPQITVAMVKYGPRDAPCCPSDVVSQSYLFNAGAGEFVATSFDARVPSPGSVPVRVVADPLNAEINNNIPGSPPATAIEF